MPSIASPLHDSRGAQAIIGGVLALAGLAALTTAQPPLMIGTLVLWSLSTLGGIALLARAVKRLHRHRTLARRTRRANRKDHRTVVLETSA